MAIEKLKGPSFRKRWDSALSVRGNSLARFRRASPCGPLALAKPSARLAETFKRRKALALTHMPGAGARRRPHARSVTAPRKPVRAAHSGFFSFFLMRRKLLAITLPPSLGNPVEFDLWMEMLDSADVKAFVRADMENARALYAAFCNVDWKKGSTIWGCSWRMAGHYVAELRNQYENYLDFYCSGNEGYVAEDVEELLARLGWTPCLAQDDAT